MVNRRINGEPLQYILGTQPFGPLNLLTRPPVLIPRPETEHWVIKLSELLSPTAQNPISLLDLGTGSGCIPLLLCHLWPPASLKAHAVDISPHAIRLARDNARLSDIASTTDNAQYSNNPRNTFTTSLASFTSIDFPDPASRAKFPFDVITSNPPYIPTHEYNQLPRSVKHFEDPRALCGGQDGYDFYHAIARLVSQTDILKPTGGLLALEVGHDQAVTVEQIMRDTRRFRHTDIWKDLWGKERTVLAHT
ncbi:S-adenosyl-L-methionine-dependent methyltransferase [Panaeolus papilionaceus]|nr:S-adenosyl-L-methionine-dependent methyltransferase [Panaeolus papilionaceus]